jgi:hypothetical protein
MSNELKREDIIGHHLRGIVQHYESLDAEFAFALNYFLLDTGVAFRLPAFDAREFEAAEIPSTAEEIHHPLLHRALHARITRVCIARDAKEWEADVVAMQVESGLWIGQLTDAALGAGGPGVVFEESCFLDDPVDFWSRASD